MQSYTKPSHTTPHHITVAARSLPAKTIDCPGACAPTTEHVNERVNERANERVAVPNLARANNNLTPSVPIVLLEYQKY